MTPESNQVANGRFQLCAAQGKAVVEQLGALLAPVAAPVAALSVIRAKAVKAGKYVEGVGSGQDTLRKYDELDGLT